MHNVVQKVTHIALQSGEYNVSQSLTKGCYYWDITKCEGKGFPFSVSAVLWLFLQGLSYSR